MTDKTITRITVQEADFIWKRNAPKPRRPAFEAFWTKLNYVRAPDATRTYSIRKISMNKRTWKLLTESMTGTGYRLHEFNNTVHGRIGSMAGIPVFITDVEDNVVECEHHGMPIGASEDVVYTSRHNNYSLAGVRHD